MRTIEQVIVGWLELARKFGKPIDPQSRFKALSLPGDIALAAIPSRTGRRCWASAAARSTAFIETSAHLCRCKGLEHGHALVASFLEKRLAFLFRS
jgi:hypothetical protein